MKSWWVVLCLGACASAAAADESLVSIGDQKYLTDTWTGGKVSTLRYPTLGCPAIVKAGTTGTALVKLADGGLTADFELSISATGDPAAPTFALALTGVSFDATKNLYALTYQVPATVPYATYDVKLAVPSASIADLQHNALRVATGDPSTWTFISISDSHFNDPRGLVSPENYNTGSYTAWSIIQQMKKEIRALNPTFAIVTGDVVFGLDYDYEYEGAWLIWKDLGVPVFMVPGNHDGYACIEERHFLGITSPVRDGLDYWHKYFGPTHYSFDFGGIHFQGVNSMDGTKQRRDGFLIVIENYGGDLLPAQQNWIASDLAATSKPVIPFMHHNPMGPYRPNGTFGMWSWVLARIWDFITNGNLDDFSQTWNTEATGAFLKNAYNGPSKIAFIGHEHYDAIKSYGTTTYKLVTTAGADSKNYWGYTVVKVADSQVVDYIYLNADFQSVPTGNLHVAHTTPNNGAAAIEKAKVKSGLSKSYDVTVEFFMASAPAYAATNGTVLQWAPVNATTSKVWVKAASPVAVDINHPKEVEVTVTTANVAGSVATASSGSGGGGSGCGAPIGGARPTGYLFIALLPLVLLFAFRYIRRA